MARIRSIHPGLSTDEAFMSMTMAAKAAWPLLWTECDDQGVFEWKPVVLKARLLPADDINFSALLAEWEGLDVIRGFVVDGRSYGAVKNFRKYQRPKKPNATYPLPDEFRTYVHIDTPSSEPVPHQVGTKPGKPPQMEDGGWRMEEGTAAQHTGTPREAEPPPKPTTSAQPMASETPTSPPAEFPNIPWVLIRDPMKNDRLEAELREAAGLENDPSSGLLDLSPMVELIDKGWSLPKLILPKLREMKAKGKRGSTWRYYVPAIVEAQQANAAIPANHQPAKVATAWVTEDDPRWPDLAARYQREKGRALSPTGSRHRPGMGYEFPRDWLEQEAA